MSILSPRQQQELNRAIVQYIGKVISDNSENLDHGEKNGALQHHDLVDKVANLLDVPTTSEDLTTNYLEKKWSTVLRLQRKIMDLTDEVSNLKTIIEAKHANGETFGAISKNKINWLPTSVFKTFPTQTHQSVNTVAVHPYLPLIMAGCSDGTLSVWNIANDDPLIPEKSIRAHSRAVNRIRWLNSPVELSVKAGASNKLYIFASCSSDLSIKIWDGNSNSQIRILTGHDHTVSSIAFLPSKPSILYSVSRDKTTKIWDSTNGYCTRTFIGHSDWVRDLDVIAAKQKSLGDFILTCSNDQSVRLSHADSGTGLCLLVGHSHVIELVRFLPMHSNVHIDKYLKENSDRFPSLPPELVSAPIYDEVLGYKYCVSAGRDNIVKLWLMPPAVVRPNAHPLPAATNNSQGWHIADLTGHQSWVKTLQVHPNGRFIFSAGDDKSIRVWDLSTLATGGRVTEVKKLMKHEGFVNDINAAPLSEPKDTTNEDILQDIESRMRCVFVSGGTDNTVRLWS